MKRLYLLVVIFIGFDLSGCALVNGAKNQSSTPPTPTQDQVTAVAPASKPAKKTTAAAKQTAEKNPLTVQVFPKGLAPEHPYKVIAQEIVSKYNNGGIKRQEATIRDTLRTLAASVGGDAVINVTRDGSHVKGTVVTFEKTSIG